MFNGNVSQMAIATIVCRPEEQFQIHHVIHDGVVAAVVLHVAGPTENSPHLTIKYGGECIIYFLSKFVTSNVFLEKILCMKRVVLSLLFLCVLFYSSVVAQSDYKLAGPYEVVARDGEYCGSKGGSERDMKAAWGCAQKGQHEKALEIINAYADKLQRLDGHDAPLCLIQGYWLCRAMMIEKAHRTPAWSAMLRRAMVPTMEYYN